MAKSQAQPVEAEKVSIARATVEIRVLTVSGKQMTISVFKQLPYELPGNVGDLWGLIRWGEEGPYAIWDKGGELHKFGIPHYLRRHNPGLEEMGQRCGRLGAAAKVARFVAGGAAWEDPGYPLFPRKTASLFNDLERCARNAEAAGAADDELEWARRSLAEAKECARAWLVEFCGTSDAAEVEKIRADRARQAQALHAARDADSKLLYSLPQLFIAV